MSFSPHSILPFLILFQAILFSSFLIVSTKGKRNSNILLATLLLLIGFQMGGFILFDLGYEYLTVRFNCAFGFVYGVLLYLYTKSLIFKDYKPSAVDLLHFIPFNIILILAAIGIEVCQSKINFLYVASILIYVVLSFREIGKYRTVLKQTQSDFKRQNLSWLKLTLNLSIVVFTADFLQFFSNFLPTGPWIAKALGILVFVVLLLFISIMVFKGLIQPEIFSGINKEDEEIAAQEGVKYASSPLSDKELTDSLQLLENYMVANKPFLEPSLSLNELANALNMPSRKLSQVINSQMNQNFLDYINSKRIEESMKLMAMSNDQKQTVQEVMYAVGFNSKSAFHAAFRKKTGVTPTEFKSNIQSK